MGFIGAKVLAFIETTKLFSQKVIKRGWYGAILYNSTIGSIGLKKKTSPSSCLSLQFALDFSTQNRKGAEVLQMERTQKCIAVDAVA